MARATRFLVLALGIVAAESTWPCSGGTYPASQPPASNVNALRPADIGIVAALGDYFTVGTGAGASDISEVELEWQGLAFSIGGDEDGNATLTQSFPNTLPLALKRYNSALVGVSEGFGGTNTSLNWARGPDSVQNLTRQATEFAQDVQRFENWQTKWKLLTIFIGVNDLCHSCSASGIDAPVAGPTEFEAELESVLLYLQQAVPKLLVSIVQPFDPTLYHSLKGVGNCAVHLQTACSCGVSDDAVARANVTAATIAFRHAIGRAAARPEFSTTADFGVVVQPFAEGITLEQEDTAPNCFYFSEKAHAKAAAALWNNLMQPTSSKQTGWGSEEALCPQQGQFLCTSENSENDCMSFKFTCDSSKFRSETAPKSVHELRAGDIDVVGALGDSLTAAYAALSVDGNDIDYEYRGVSFSGGGDMEFSAVLTLPNIIKKYNPSVVGFATGSSYRQTPPLKPESGLNRALSGGIVQDLLREAQDYVATLNSTVENWEEKWKLLTIFIGANNLCWLCEVTGNPFPFTTGALYRSLFEEALDYLLETVPRLYVNVILPVNVTIIQPLNEPALCKFIHTYWCYCGTNDDPEILGNVSRYVKEYQEQVIDLVAQKKYDTDTFAIGLQPFPRDTQPPLKKDGGYDYSYWGPDCFHLSAKSHAQFALSLWNNMLQADGEKATQWYLGEDLTCPSKEKFLCTPRNSEWGCGAAPSPPPDDGSNPWPWLGPIIGIGGAGLLVGGGYYALKVLRRKSYVDLDPKF